MHQRFALRGFAAAVVVATGVACASEGGAIGSSGDALAATPATSAVAESATPPDPATVRLTAVGDTILGNTSAGLPPDPASYLNAVKQKIRWNAQVRFANLEGTLTNVSNGKCGGHNGGSCFAFR